MSAISSPATMVVGSPSLSPDGLRAAWLIAAEGGQELVVFDVASACVIDQVRVDAERCRAFMWTQAPGVGLSVAHGAGGETGRLHRFDANTRRWRRIGEADGMRERLVGLSASRPTEILLRRQADGAAACRYDIVSLLSDGCETAWRAEDEAAVYFDHAFVPRLTEVLGSDGSREFRHAADGTLFLHVPAAHAMSLRVLGFSGRGDEIFLVAPLRGSGSRVIAVACVAGAPAGKPRELFRVDRAVIDDVLFAASGGAPRLTRVERLRRHFVAIDRADGDAIRRWNARFGRDAEIFACPERAPWLVGAGAQDGATRYGLWNADKDEWTPLADAQSDAPAANRARAIRMRSVRILTRDGQRMVVHVSLPRGTSAARVRPVALLIHGGPWRRVPLAGDARRSALIDAGCLVVEPNFRGSTNLGADWINAGDRQWGLAMQDDLEDALAWAIARGWADPERIVLVGGSYGGYAALQMAATTKFPIRAVIATSPLTDLRAFVRSPPSFWSSSHPMLVQRIGDPVADESRLRSASPMTNAAAIRCPVLLAHGYHDARLPVADTTRMFMSLAQAGGQASLALFLDEGHELVGSVNRDAWQRLFRRFLARHVLDEAQASCDDRPLPAGMKWLQSPAAASACERISPGAGARPFLPAESPDRRHA